MRILSHAISSLRLMIETERNRDGEIEGRWRSEKVSKKKKTSEEDAKKGEGRRGGKKEVTKREQCNEPRAIGFEAEHSRPVNL